MKQKTKSKFLTTLNIILLVLLFAIPAAAYWAGAIGGANKDTTADIEIGEGKEVTTSVTVENQSSTGKLVPVGYDQDDLDFDDINLTFSVLWNGEGAEGAIGTLVVTIDKIEVFANDNTGVTADLTDPTNGTDALFTVTVTSGTGVITAGLSQDVVVNVEFTNEPANVADYALIAKGNLIVTLSFVVKGPNEA